MTSKGKPYRFHKTCRCILRPRQRSTRVVRHHVPENADWPAAKRCELVSIALRPNRERIMTVSRRGTRLGKTHTALSWAWRATVVVADSEGGCAQDRAARLSALGRTQLPMLFARHGASRGIAALYPPTSMSLRRSQTASRDRAKPSAISSPPRARQPAAITRCSWWLR